MLTDELKAIIEQADVLPDEGEKQTKPRYKILSAENALQPQPPIEWIVDGLISTESGISGLILLILFKSTRLDSSGEKVDSSVPET